MPADQPEALNAFRNWLRDELRDAGCEIRALSPEGMAEVTVRRLAERGWSVLPPGAVPATLTFREPTAEEASTLKAQFLEAMAHPPRLVMLPPTDDERVDAAYQRGLADAKALPVEPLHAPLELRHWAQEAFGAEHALSPIQCAIGGAVLDSIWSRGLAEGRAQATEGWERRWGTRYPDGYVLKAGTEAAARDIAARVSSRTVVSRLVGPWEPAEPEAVRACPRIAHESGVVLACTVDHGEPFSGLHANSYHRVMWDDSDDRVINDAEPASGGVVEPSSPPTAEAKPGHCGNDVYVHEPHEWLSLSGDGKTVTKRQCEGTGPMAGRRPAPVRRQHDPGALTEEPDLYERKDGAQ